MKFEDKVILITGAARGIGEEVARQFSREAAKLVVIDIDADRVTAFAEKLVQSGGEAIGLGCDITNSVEIAEVKKQAIARFGRVDILINNAAAQQFGPGDFTLFDIDRYRKSFDVNVLGCIRMVEAFLPEMLERGDGYIINTSSSLAIRPNPVVQHLMPYVTSKGAVLTWTYALAAAMRARGVGVSLFCPGLTTTRTDESSIPQKNGWLDHTPAALATPGTVQACAAMLLQGLREGRFLISSEPDYASALVSFAQAGLDPEHFSL